MNKKMTAFVVLVLVSFGVYLVMRENPFVEDPFRGLAVEGANVTYGDLDSELPHIPADARFKDPHRWKWEVRLIAPHELGKEPDWTKRRIVLWRYLGRSRESISGELGTDYRQYRIVDPTIQAEYRKLTEKHLAEVGGRTFELVF